MSKPNVTIDAIIDRFSEIREASNVRLECRPGHVTIRMDWNGDRDAFGPLVRLAASESVVAGIQWTATTGGSLTEMGGLT